jgi:hypothetical protein
MKNTRTPATTAAETFPRNCSIGTLLSLEDCPAGSVAQAGLISKVKP